MKYNVFKISKPEIYNLYLFWLIYSKCSILYGSEASPNLVLLWIYVFITKNSVCKKNLQLVLFWLNTFIVKYYVCKRSQWNIYNWCMFDQIYSGWSIIYVSLASPKFTICTFWPNIFIMKYNVCERSEPKFLQLLLFWPNIGYNSVHILQVY